MYNCTVTTNAVITKTGHNFSLWTYVSALTRHLFHFNMRQRANFQTSVMHHRRLAAYLPFKSKFLPHQKFHFLVWHRVLINQFLTLCRQASMFRFPTSNCHIDALMQMTTRVPSFDLCHKWKYLFHSHHLFPFIQNQEIPFPHRLNKFS